MINQFEEISRVTPLGLRFWDTLFDRPVGEGLNVTAYPLSSPLHRTTATSNRSGVFLLQNLPGLREAEYGQGDPAYWTSVAKKPFVVEVTDSQGRFQPFRFQTDLPHQGLFTVPCISLSPPVGLFNHLGVPLYSAAARGLSSGFAVIRADLWDVTNDQPAAWAMVDASLEGQRLARGFADHEGRVALFFPYPELVDSVSSPPESPLIGNRPPLIDQEWQIQLDAFYTPMNPTPIIPDLCQTLDQSPATLLNTLSPTSPLTNVTLHYGEELVVRSESLSTVVIIP